MDFERLRSALAEHNPQALLCDGLEHNVWSAWSGIHTPMWLDDLEDEPAA